MSGLGLGDELRALVRDHRTWVRLGQVVTVEESEVYGFLYTVTLVPSLEEVQARGAWLMGGTAEEGVFVPIAVDDEVLVFCPDGEINDAIILAGAPSTPNPLPTDWDGQTSILIKHLTEVAIESAAVKLGSRDATDPVSLDSLVRAAIESAVGAVADALSAGALAAAAGDGGVTALESAATALAGFTAPSTGATKITGE